MSINKVEHIGEQSSLGHSIGKSFKHTKQENKKLYRT